MVYPNTFNTNSIVFSSVFLFSSIDLIQLILLAIFLSKAIYGNFRKYKTRIYYL